MLESSVRCYRGAVEHQLQKLDTIFEPDTFFELHSMVGLGETLEFSTSQLFSPCPTEGRLSNPQAHQVSRVEVKNNRNIMNVDIKKFVRGKIYNDTELRVGGV